MNEKIITITDVNLVNCEVKLNIRNRVSLTVYPIWEEKQPITIELNKEDTLDLIKELKLLLKYM